ncbi:MAG: ribosome recycling factor [Patescibacteria group bacterium]|nr:ribosome recycling factor [Patescibacteria group bacterium]
MSEIIDSHKEGFEGALEHLRTELASLRTGRANPALVESIQVEAYGSKQALVGLASITTPDSKTIQIEPWDKTVVGDIEKGIQEANLGFNPTVAGTVIRINLPPMTEEGRKNMIKLMNEKLENSRIQVRQVREDARSKIKAAEDKGEMSEDEMYRDLEELDKVAANWNEKIKAVGEEKEKEIMTV